MNKTLCFKLAKQPSQTELRAEKGGFERSYIDISQAKNVILCRRAAVEGDMSSALLGYELRHVRLHPSFFISAISERRNP